MNSMSCNVTFYSLANDVESISVFVLLYTVASLKEWSNLVEVYYSSYYRHYPMNWQGTRARLGMLLPSLDISFYFLFFGQSSWKCFQCLADNDTDMILSMTEIALLPCHSCLILMIGGY